MREAIGGTWLFGLVITFIVFFASFLAVSINYSKAFHVKNNVVDLISKYEGNNCKARKKISEYLRTSGALVTGDCLSGYEGYNLAGEPANDGKAYYCIASDETDSTTFMSKQFYRVIVFYKIDLPMLGNIATFKIKGETETIIYPKDEINTNC